MILLDIFVPGTPAPKGSMRSVKSRTTGKTVTLHDNKRTVPWGRAMADTFTLHYLGDGTEDGPVRVDAAFVFERPASHYTRGKVRALRLDAPKHHHSVPPDCDKVARNLCDALTTSRVVSDDCRVAQLAATKRWARSPGDSGVYVTVTAL